jgi:hypothetical protein
MPGQCAGGGTQGAIDTSALHGPRTLSWQDAQMPMPI